MSRVRTTLGADAVERYDGGYRLGVPPDDVDALLLRRLAREAGAALDAGEATRAADLAGRAAGLDVADENGDHGPLAELRHDAAADQQRSERVLGLALAAAGRDQDALPHLEAVHGAALHDTAVTGALLRSLATTAGPAAALERYEAYREDLADRLGVDPDPALQRLHRELLVADSPVRDGVHFDADTLLGREDDLAELRAAVRRSRLVSVIGPGGLGKTRVAHVLAREATQPRVYFVELVGVTSGDDVVAEVGAALGVRGSVTGRRTLTPAQLADVRSQIAAELDTAPTLLVLDNCEHVLESVASLVALLLVTTRDLRVLTTSRAPLGLAAEQVVALRQLAADDAAELFDRRARAARADADLPRDVVARHRRPARRAAAGHRAGRGPGADDDGRGGTPPARRPLRAAALPGPVGPRATPHADRGHRVVVGPPRPGRPGGHGQTVRLPRRVHAGHGPRRPRARRPRPRRDAGRAVAAHRHRGPRRDAVPDAGDRPRVRRRATDRDRSARRRPALPGRVGRGVRRPVRGRAVRSGRDRGRRRAGRRGEQPGRRAAPGRPRRRPRHGGPAAGLPGRVLDDLGQPPAHLHDRRLRRVAPRRLGPARGAAHHRAARPLLADRAPELDAQPLHRRAARHDRALGRPGAPVCAGGLHDVRRSRNERVSRSTSASRRWPERPTRSPRRWVCSGPA